MPTYMDIMKQPFTRLGSAAGQWEHMAGLFAEQGEVYRREVESVARSDEWQGFSALSARKRFEITHRQYEAAAQEAEKIAKALREARDEFTRLHGLLKNVVAEAEAAGMVVHSNGTVSFLPEGAQAIARNDPDYQEYQRRNGEAEAEWSAAIKRHVDAITEYDASVRVLLEGLANDEENANWFTGGTDRLDEIALERSVALGERIAAGEGTQEDFEQLQIILSGQRDENGDYSLRFSQSLLDQLGAETFIHLTNAAFAPPDDYNSAHLKEDLAHLVGSALSKPGGFYNRWMEELDAASKASYPARFPDGSNLEVRGYQSLVTLMHHGEGYEAHFLHDLAENMRRAEDPAKGGKQGIWVLDRESLGEENRQWFANDPLDALFAIMAQHPDAATSYFDPGQGPGSEERRDRIRYFFDEDGRDWNVLSAEYQEWHGNTSTIKTMHLEDPDARSGLGAGLLAATTGRPPDTQGELAPSHSKAQARVMHHSIEMFSELYEKDSVPSNLGPFMAAALNDYVADVHETLTAQNPDFNYDDGNGEAWTSEQGSHIGVSGQELVRVMRAVSDGGEVFSSLYETHQAYSASLLDHSFRDPSVDPVVTARDVNSTFGTLNAIGADIIYTDRDVRFGKADDVARYTYHGGGVLITGIPVVGDGLQRILDSITYEWSKDVKTLADQMAINEVSEQWMKDATSLKHMVSSAAEYNGFDPKSDEVKTVRQEGEQTYSASRHKALAYLRSA